MLQAELSRAQEAAATAEAACVAVVLAVETSAHKAVLTRDSVVTWVNDAEDRATIAEREAWERVLRVEVESTLTLASTHEEVEGLV
jgi:hypothetical protein